MMMLTCPLPCPCTHTCCVAMLLAHCTNHTAGPSSPHTPHHCAPCSCTHCIAMPLALHALHRQHTTSPCPSWLHAPHRCSPCGCTHYIISTHCVTVLLASALPSSCTYSFSFFSSF